MSDLPSTTATPKRARIGGLDGLRAIAVIGVLLYHADVPWAVGGFLGVDVFFVLSGYLVTNIVLEGFGRTGGLGFRRFWSSRLRRLAPAQITMLVVSTVAMGLFYRGELSGLRGAVIAALTATTNWYLIATEGSYFEQVGRPPVFRHLWSLAIELQFYLVFPPLLVLALRRWSRRLDLIVAALLAGIFVSAIYMAILYDSADPSRAYFSTVARLGAPFVGAVLALVWRPDALERGPIAALGSRVATAGLVALVGLTAMFHMAGDRSALMYRGGFLVSAILSGVVVAAVVHPNSWLGRRWALGHPALVAIGVRSYGLYLWHWPIFVMIRPRIDVGWSWGVTFVVRIAATVIATELCYRFVERPWHLRTPDASFAGVRRRLLQAAGIPTRTRLAALGSVAMVLTATLILMVPHPPRDAIAESLREGEAALNSASPTTTPDGSGAPTDPSDDPTSPDPGMTSTTAPPAPGSEPVTLVGDSVMLGSAPDLIAVFGQRANIDAKVARQADSLGPVIRQLGVEGRLNQTVVVQVGINGTVTAEDLRAIEAAADGRRLLVVNARVPRSWEQENNKTVAQVVPKLVNAEVVDWYGHSNERRDWFLSDGVHLTAEGRQAYAELVRSAVDRD